MRFFFLNLYFFFENKFHLKSDFKKEKYKYIYIYIYVKIYLIFLKNYYNYNKVKVSQSLVHIFFFIFFTNILLLQKIVAQYTQFLFITFMCGKI